MRTVYGCLIRLCVRMYVAVVFMCTLRVVMCFYVSSSRGYACIFVQYVWSCMFMRAVHVYITYVALCLYVEYLYLRVAIRRRWRVCTHVCTRHRVSAYHDHQQMPWQHSSDPSPLGHRRRNYQMCRINIVVYPYSGSSPSPFRLWSLAAAFLFCSLDPI